MPVASGQGKWPVTYGVTRDTIEAKKDARCAICVQKSCFICEHNTSTRDALLYNGEASTSRNDDRQQSGQNANNNNNVNNSTVYAIGNGKESTKNGQGKNAQNTNNKNNKADSKSQANVKGQANNKAQAKTDEKKKSTCTIL